MGKVNIIELLLGKIFPTDITCNGCGREIFSGYFCDECEDEVSVIGEARCVHCGRLAYTQAERCDSCKGRETYFDSARSVFQYKDIIASLIHKLKFRGQKYIASIFGDYLAHLYLNSDLKADVIVYPPMTKQKQKARGYNQAGLIAHAFGELVDVAVCDDAILKIKETQSQVGLTHEERSRNLNGSFKLNNKDAINGKRVIIIDDVMTTGATVESVAKILKRGGAEKVYVLTVASVSMQGKI